ncbi:MAG: DNA methylase [Candidatus Yanofskybacteria bacterium RIFCSPHIGHO2_02_FULL_43_22]|uniref:DNA methylase n=1 Tax=Candidatus Yanofskybacteria bacterium RIFCSPHIGHO2_02_FULL_43_22 TaxID=1802681 RepID=A0A1F8FMS2_9BACT|nr:MAG: DNA methylase [Candidatus Yanofskybacteria bacterium RIFCSPHIGHO2_02_FULL_43_22]
MPLNLSDNEKRDVVKYLEAGKPLPDKYRFLLFKDDREVELLWNGKTDEVTNVVLPFQTIEQIDEPRGEEKIGLQDSLFDTSGRQIHGWTNKLIWGDNKLILSSLKNGPLRKEIEAQGGLKLIYIDPPFDVGADFSMDIKIGEDEEESFTKKPSVIETVAYRDTWGKGADSFIAMIYERLKLMHDLLAEDGSIYVHCDWRLSSYMRLVLDEIFGKDNFRNEIAWCYLVNKGNFINKYPPRHDTILFYGKTDNNYFDSEITRMQPAESTLKRWGKYADENGEVPFDRLTPGMQKVAGKAEKPYLLRGGVQVDWVIGIPGLNSGDTNEAIGYPTQKPEKLIEMFMKTSTKEGDLVADFFCGSGTTLAVAEKLGRKWIGSDLGKFGIHTSRKRMVGVQRELKKEGKNFRPFEILNLGRYERDNFLTVNEDLRAEQKSKQAENKDKEFINLIVSAYKAEPVVSFVNIVAKKRDRLVAVGPINTPVSHNLVKAIVKECKEKGITKIDVLGFDYEMGLDFQEYKDEGIDIAFKIIPREVFDKRAVEKGQVKFYDVAFIEIKPIIKGKGNIKELSIELTDFSVFYNQDNTGEIEEELRAGGSKVVVENGQVIKISKDKKTELIEREVLTKKWKDWIDYWAVDYDFSSRKEIIKVIENDKEKEVWTGDYIFDNEWQEFRTKKKRNLELVSAPKELSKGNYKVAVKVVDIFGNDTTRVIDVKI